MCAAAIRPPKIEPGASALGVTEAIARWAGPLPQISLDYEADIFTLWINLEPEPKPVFTLPVIDSVSRVQDAVVGLWGDDPDRPVLYLAYRSRGPVFSLGGDLDFYLDCLRSNDRAGLLRYAENATKVIRMNRNGLNGTVITLTNVHAKAIGGGIDPARACNVMIAEEGASFSYPEINYNHFPISAVPVLARHTGPLEAERILLSGREFSAAEFMAKGAVDAIAPKGEGDEWVRRYASTNIASHSARLKLIAAFNGQAAGLESSLADCAESWTDHIMSLRPIEIARLQRIATAQERMLGRLLREPAALPPSFRGPHHPGSVGRPH